MTPGPRTLFPLRATWFLVTGSVLLAGCSVGSGRGGDDATDPLAAGCGVVERHQDLRVGREDTAALNRFSDELEAAADSLSTSDAAELRPLARAAAAVADAPPGADADAAYADYLQILAATSGVCAAAGSAQP